MTVKEVKFSKTNTLHFFSFFLLALTFILLYFPFYFLTILIVHFMHDSFIFTHERKVSATHFMAYIIHTYIHSLTCFASLHLVPTHTFAVKVYASTKLLSDTLQHHNSSVFTTIFVTFFPSIIFKSSGIYNDREN